MGQSRKAARLGRTAFRDHSQTADCEVRDRSSRCSNSGADDTVPNRKAAQMAEDDSDSAMSGDEVISSAQQIVDQLRERWRESDLPISVLAHQMIGAGITDLTNERGVDATLELLRELVSDIERAALKRSN